MNELLELGLEYKVNMNAMVILYALKYPKTKVSIPEDLTYLITLEYVTPDGKALTPKGFQIVTEIEALFKKSKSKPLPFCLVGENNRIKEYIELWPRMTLPSGKASRASEKTLLKCFTWFFTNYHYTWETVLQATEMYVNNQQDKQFKMCRTNQYFIDKTLGGVRESLLADYCELILNGEDNSAPVITQKVV